MSTVVLSLMVELTHSLGQFRCWIVFDGSSVNPAVSVMDPKHQHDIWSPKLLCFWSRTSRDPRSTQDITKLLFYQNRGEDLGGKKETFIWGEFSRGVAIAWGHLYATSETLLHLPKCPRGWQRCQKTMYLVTHLQNTGPRSVQTT